MFIYFKRLNKLLASLLVAVMLLTNSIALFPVYAATSGNSYGQNENTDDLTPKQQTAQLLNQVIPHYLENGKQQGPEWLRTSDINFTFAEDFKPLYSFETLQPFTKEIVDGKLGFWQGRYAHQSGANNTANLGVGLRWLSEDKTTIKGINAFYDYGFKHDLSRLGFGAEYFNKHGEYRINFYIPLSDDRFVGTTSQADGILYSYIRAVGGFDFEVGTSLANAPWLSLYASGFQYDNKYKADEHGYKLRTKMQITPKVSMEMGYSNSNLTDGGLYGKVLFQLADAAGPAWRGGNTEAMSDDISYKLLQKVQRENDIKTETFTKLIAYTGELSVTVTNTNGAPLQGAQVQAYHNGKPAGTAATTDASGSAVLSGLAAGDYIVRAAYFSISGDSPAVTVQKDQPANTTISLAIVGGNANVHVIDSAGADVSGATVTAEAAGGTQGRQFSMFKSASAAAFAVTAVTDATGIARFNNLPPGNYKFTVIHSGQEMKSLAVAVTDGATSNGTVVLPASGGNIVAMISDANSKAAINGATVALKNGTTVIELKTTDSNGTAVFSGLTAGITYTLAASAANYDSNSIDVTVTDKETIAAPMALTSQGGRVTITVTDGANPLSGAMVRLTGNGEDRTATTDDSGEATFTNVPAGSYTVQASLDGYNTNTTNVTVVSEQTAVATVTLGRQKSHVTITVSDGANPLSGATVRLTGNGESRTAYTNAYGDVVFSDLPTGTYTVEASKDSYETVSQEVTVVSDQTDTVTIALTKLATINIRVTDGTNTLSGVTISVTVNGQVITKTTNSQGLATFKLPSFNSYDFTLTKEGYHTKTITRWVNDGTELSTESLTRQTGNAAITVTDRTNPLSGATIRLTGNGEDRSATTNDTGEASFTDVPTGTYTFEASKDGYTNGTADVIISYGNTATATIALRQIVDATITVKDYDTGELINDATVSVTVNGQVIKKTTDEAGIATFTQIPAGYYTFIVIKAGYSTSSLSTTISGQTETITLIRPKGQITITVKGTDGQPISGVTVSTMVELGGEMQPVTKTTDTNGIALFTELPTHVYTFTATKAGYVSNTTEVIVLGAQQKAGTITLSPSPGNAEITVTDGTSPLSGATVSVTVNGQEQTVNTATNGVATFTGIPTGTYTFTATMSGYNSGSANNVIITGGTTTAKTITLTRQTGSARINVKDSGLTGLDAQISEATVTITGNGVSKIVNTDSTGVADFSNLPVGDYTCSVSKDGYTSGSANLTIVAGQRTTKTVSITKTLIEIATYVHEYTATGPTTLLAGVKVTITHSSSGQSWTETSQAGWASVYFHNVPVGTYTIRMEKTGYKTIEETRVITGYNGDNALVFTMYKQ